MAARSTTNNKLDKLYLELSEVERVRMQAKLSRAHDTAGMDRLRRATPPEHADAYNRALGLLRVLNGHVLDWIAIFQIGMERDRMRLLHATAEATRHWLAVHSLGDLWRLIPYPVTESEYHALVQLDRAQLLSLNDYVDSIWDADTLRPELYAIVQDYREADEPGDAEQEAFWQEYEARIVATVKAAIERGELPTPSRAPKGTVNAKPGDIWLPADALTDWAEGTTEEKHKPIYPGACVPPLGEVFGGDLAEWEVRPDSEADAVKARRAQIRDTFLTLRAVPRDESERLPSLDPPLTPSDLERDRRLAEELFHAWNASRDFACFALDVAKTHATQRAQLEDLSNALETIRRDYFGGEDPLWTEVRARLEIAQSEARRFEDAWASAHVVMRSALREAAGLVPFPMDAWNAETKTFDIPPVPLPAGEHDPAGTVGLIRAWAA